MCLCPPNVSEFTVSDHLVNGVSSDISDGSHIMACNNNGVVCVGILACMSSCKPVFSRCRMQFFATCSAVKGVMVCLVTSRSHIPTVQCVWPQGEISTFDKPTYDIHIN